MTQIKTLKIRLKTTPKTEELLLDTMHTYLQVCNVISKYIYETKELTMKTVNAALYHNLRAKYGLGAQMTQSAMRAVIGNYKTILSSNHPWALVKFKKPHYDLTWNRDYLLLNELFSISTLKGRVKLPFYSKDLDFKPILGGAKLLRRKGKFYLHVSLSYQTPNYLFNNSIVGIDRGIRFLATTYDNNGKTMFYGGGPMKQQRLKYKKLRQQLQSKGTRSAKRRLKAIGRRENRWVSNANHCLSKALVSSYPSGTLFVLEDLSGISGAVSKIKHKDRYLIVSWPYYDLAQKLKYKAAKNGSKVIEVNPQYTSQTCPKCGHTEKANRDHVKHLFTCKECGYKSNDDRIAAMNLYQKALTMV